MTRPSAWASLSRRRGRSALTALGMACGVLALVLMASMAEHFSLLAEHFREAFGGRVFVCERLSFWAGGGILSEEKVAEVGRAAKGCTVVPMLVGRLHSQRMIVLGLPEVLVGLPPAQAPVYWSGIPLAQGRLLGAGDEGTSRAVLGSNVAYSMGARVGDTVRVLDHAFEVVGVLAHTGALEDTQMLAPLPAAQETLSREGLVTSVLVVPPAGTTPAGLAGEIRRGVKGVEVVDPAQMHEAVERSLRVYRALTLGTGLVAAATGALCIVITMMVGVYERTYEIGLLKAIGASNGQVMADFLGEALVLALAGWLLGIGLAAGFIAGWDATFRAEGMFLFALTPRVAVGSLAAALLLGMAAGTLPALSAARQDPVAALRRRP